MRKIIRGLTVLALAGGLGALSAGPAFASAASSPDGNRQPAGKVAYQLPQRRAILPDDGNQNPPQKAARPAGDGMASAGGAVRRA
jgi:hypothetical protein